MVERKPSKLCPYDTKLMVLAAVKGVYLGLIDI